MPQLTLCDQTPELTTVGANAQLSTRADRAALLWKTLQQAEVFVHVPSVAGVVGKHSPCSSLVAAEVAGAHNTGRADTVLLPVGGNLFDPDSQGFEHIAAGGEGSGPALGTGGREERGKQEEQEKDLEEKMNPRSFPNMRGALSDEEPEIVDMSLHRLTK